MQDKPYNFIDLDISVIIITPALQCNTKTFHLININLNEPEH